ncbi:MAG TPA: ABC transporter ATP-binding protein [Dictyoglomaceae bacterium]|nr:ABC transporter ATP-binding protein [Dictyoglomaceae bacterium]HOL38757.1 ABC transporter ATP-binding protein [Dictyoglomaceae bacterium]HOP94539.1 ABC transporter ATP-binding protein [Dictyoglomaceae bacterium]HPP15494.1 ABC transporter ATP-binding protein [Dictyoglomaceae bacterium]HPU43097.1 ABC transporter ATP-binding protein [Dictyoglomaceae bacterium]
MNNNETLLKVEDLKVWFEIRKSVVSQPMYVKAVDGISFDLKKGESISLVGESGSGKTTLGRTLLRLYKATGGKIFFEEQDITNLDSTDLKWYRKETGFVQQDPFGALPSHFTIYRTLEEPLIINKIGTPEERKNLIFNALEEVKLTPVIDFIQKYPHMLSGGQMQRVVIARALIMRPKLVIADEPVSMLDASVRIEILELLKELQERHQMSLIYITHDLATVRAFSNWIFIMYAGNLVEKAQTKELLQNPLHPYTKALLSAIPDPDPENRKKLRDIPPGEPPNLVELPQGCRFHPRCANVMDICKKEEPKDIEVKNNHWVKCWLFQEG